MKDTEKINSRFMISPQECLRIKYFQIILNSYFLLSCLTKIEIAQKLSIGDL